MSEIDRALDRLFRSAASAPQEANEAMPFGFDARVLAGLRRPRQGEVTALVGLIRQGLAWASVLMIIALALNYYHSQNNVGADVDLNASAWAIIAREP